MNGKIKCNRPILILLLTSALVACREQMQSEDSRSNIYAQFPKTHNIKGALLPSLDVYLPHQLIVTDSLMVVIDQMTDKYFFKAYKTRTMEKVFEAGSKGFGPGEFTAPEFTGQIVDRDDTTYHLIYDKERRKLHYVNFFQYLDDKNFVFDNQVMPENVNDISSIVFRTDSSIAIAPSGEYEMSRFYIHKYNSGETKQVPYVPELPYPVHKNNLYPIYAHGSSCINEHLQIFATTPALLGQIDFFGFGGDFLHAVMIEKNEGLKKYAALPGYVFHQPITFFATELKHYNNHIFALMTRAYYNGSSETADNANLYVLNWEGKPIRKFTFDQPLKAFAYDPINNCFYGYTPFKEATSLKETTSFFKYDLKNTSPYK